MQGRHEYTAPEAKGGQDRTGCERIFIVCVKDSEFCRRGQSGRTEIAPAATLLQNPTCGARIAKIWRSYGAAPPGAVLPPALPRTLSAAAADNDGTRAVSTGTSR